MPLKLNSFSGGSVTLDPASTASDFTLSLPAATGTALFSHANGSVGIGTTSPAALLSIAGSLAIQEGPLAFPIQPSLTSPTGRTRVTFGPTGSNQTFTVPAGVTALLVKLWGAGGAGGNSGGWSQGSRGGGGGHTIGIIPTTPGTQYIIVVGLPGQTNYPGGQTPRYGGGGGMHSNTDNRWGGSGGGYSGIFITSVTQANALMIAGGGGGGGASRAGFGNWGGAGGGTTGQRGCAAYDNRLAASGGGGSQSAGGVAGTSQSTVGTAGSALTGGYNSSAAYGGSGGGGFFGGGGGGYFESNTMAGGGGGSGYFHPTLTRYAATFTGHQYRPAMFDDNDLIQEI